MTDLEMINKLKRYVGKASSIWNPLRYDTHAHELRQKLRDDGYGVSLLWPEGGGNSFCRAELRKGIQEWSACTPSWRYALCMAAIEALPDEEPKDTQPSYRDGLVAALEAVRKIRVSIAFGTNNEFEQAVRAIRQKQLADVMERLEAMLQDD